MSANNTVTDIPAHDPLFPPFVSIEQTGEMLGHIGRSSVLKLIRDGELQSVKVLRRRVVTRASIDAYAARCVAGAA